MPGVLARRELHGEVSLARALNDRTGCNLHGTDLKLSLVRGAGALPAEMSLRPVVGAGAGDEAVYRPDRQRAPQVGKGEWMPLAGDLTLIIEGRGDAPAEASLTLERGSDPVRSS